MATATEGFENGRSSVHQRTSRRIAGLEVYGLLLTLFAILVLLSLVSFDPRDVATNFRLRPNLVQNLIGPVGAHIGDLLFGALGLVAFFGCSTFFYFGGVLLAGRRPIVEAKTVGAFGLVIVFACVLAHVLLAGFRPFGHTPGGLTGEWVGEILRSLFATTGTLIIAMGAMGAAVLVLTGMPILEIARLPYRLARKGQRWLAARANPERDLDAQNAPDGAEGLTDDASDPAIVDTRPAKRSAKGSPAVPQDRSTPESNAGGAGVSTWRRGSTSGPQPAQDPTSAPLGPEHAATSREPAPEWAATRREEPGTAKSAQTKRSPEAEVGDAGSKALARDGKTPRKGQPKTPASSGQTATPLVIAPRLEATPPGAESTPPVLADPASQPAVAAPKSPRQPEAPLQDPEPPGGGSAPPTGGAATPAGGGLDIAEPVSAKGSPIIQERVESGILPLVADQLPLTDTLPYEFPSLSMLDYEPPARNSVNREQLAEAAKTLETKLADFGVKGKVVRIQPGPVVTMFEYKPASGVKISKIANLADDLTMALHAQRVRIVAPIPGKGVVGIEVPSAVRETVYLKEIIASKAFQEGRAKLPVCLGKDIVGHPVVADLATMPHALVAGSTGSGKSVCINAMIVSLVYRQKPSDLRLILVDPKMLELSVYDDIPHLLLPVVTEPKKATLALKWAVSEMERRYRLLAAVGVRNLSGFNVKVEKYKSGAKEPPKNIPSDELEHLPFIVIILDELADLMMVAGKEVEQSIARLAQMARAAGIHLVVATQRPSVDVVTGLIKANFPTRISFMVSQKVDSRTILDRAGAETLLGRGDMLYLPPGTSKLLRTQGCFVSDDEVERVAEHLKQYGPPDYDMDILLDDDDGGKDLSKEDYDPLFDQAVAIVTETRNPSISYLQRRLKIGYNRSARIIERMEFDAIISKPDHRGTRKVLAPALPE